MIICGIKLTHDGAVALIEDGKLIFSVEYEKLNNNPRYAEILDTASISNILNDYGYDISSIDYFAIDGWGGDDQNELAVQPRLEIREGFNRLTAFNNNEPYKLNLGLYEEKSLKHDIFQEWKFSGLKIGDTEVDYYSYLHASGHLMSAYCTSDFARKGESSYILIWDGGMYPRLYFFDYENKKVDNLGPIFLLIGNIYTIFSQHFGPFKVSGKFAKDNLSTAGKVMAYIALGNVQRELFQYFDEIYTNSYNYPMGFANIFANQFKLHIEDKGYSDEDILCSFHVYLEELLVRKLKKKIERNNNKSKNICLTGGCALNIKWNSAIRDSGIFENVYIPPFPNDSGSAIGVACNIMFKKFGVISLDWNVYSGPKIIKNSPADGWDSKECSIKDLSKIIYLTNEPVVFLNGQSELGPRALGNRSIIASPTTQVIKGILNNIKLREAYRPVSPICLEGYAKDIFIPGNKDPFMLFEHQVREEWVHKIPGIIHLDGSARLQTVSSSANIVLTELLLEFEKLSGIPLLCNTSANLNGHGFFGDVFSATSWDKVNYVWCENTLYERREKINFSIFRNTVITKKRRL
ncbi:carbamoyltransferase N-terminal domain-containing protein [Paenibacillus gorillae]|uniref:carbamoyltransferase N-terminal domain-containing protein n=1 Tax=Paenibacillus gorillae TaxID=1243662 RepID=UPI0004B57C76|nr:carbamoyltransferase N-terminal domain-containing protein [Paenibacillus gorillae]